MSKPNKWDSKTTAAGKVLEAMKHGTTSPPLEGVEPEHELKCWPNYFPHVLDGTKSFEIRENDRRFDVGDVLRIREWCPTKQSYSGRECYRRVTYMTDFEQKEGFVVLSLVALRILGIVQPTTEPAEEPVLDVVAAVRRRGDSFWLARRNSDGAHAGLAEKWEYPGGKVEPNEQLRDALVRELQEEFPGVHPTIGAVLDSIDSTYEGTTYRVTFFEVDMEDPAEHPTHHEVRWMTPEEVCASDHLPSGTVFNARHVARLAAHPTEDPDTNSASIGEESVSTDDGPGEVVAWELWHDEKFHEVTTEPLRVARWKAGSLEHSARALCYDRHPPTQREQDGWTNTSEVDDFREGTHANMWRTLPVARRHAEEAGAKLIPVYFGGTQEEDDEKG